MFKLSGRVAIVTGTSRGIGRAISRALARQGATVVGADRNGNAARVADEIVAAGGRASGETVDVTDAPAVAAMVARVVEQFGRVDVLVNNAGITRDQLVLRVKPEDWDAVLATNLTAAFTCAQAVLRPMIKQRAGRIISIGSVVGQSGNAGQASYAASKAGLIGLTKTAARELGPKGITVNAVAPGMVMTEMAKALPEEIRKKALDEAVLGTLASPEDIANAVLFLLSDAARCITGEVLRVDSGQYI